MSGNFVPVNVVGYLRVQLSDNKEPRKKAIDKTLNYWQGQWRGMGWTEFPDDKEAKRLLENVASEILSEG